MATAFKVKQNDNVEVGCIRRVPSDIIEDSTNELDFSASEECSLNSSDEYDTDLESEFRGDNQSSCTPAEDVQGKLAYLAACKNLGITPCSKFLQSLLKSEVNLKFYNLGPRGAEAVSVAMIRNSSILSLNLASNGIGEEGAIYVSKMMTDNCFVTELDLSENDLMTQGSYAVSEMLRGNSELLELNIAGNKLYEKDAEPIVEAMKENYALKALNLSNNGFGEIGGQLLGPAIDANVGLEYLNLSTNHLRRKGASAIGLGLKNNCSLRCIDLSYNGIADDGSIAIGNALVVNNTLVEIDLTCNRITLDGVAGLTKGIEVNNTLQILRLGKNPIQSNGAYEILSAVDRNSESAIEELYFDDIPVNAQFKHLLEEVLQVRSNLNVQCGVAMKGKDRVSHMQKKVDVLNLLLEYIELRGLRVVDFFRQLDKDNSKKVSRAEFMVGAKKAGIPITRRQLQKLVSILDVDGDGNIDYSEMVAIKSNEVYDAYHKKKILKKDDPLIKDLKQKRSTNKNIK